MKYRRRKASTYRRRKTFRKKRTVKRFRYGPPKPDGAVCLKIHGTYNFLVAANQVGNFCVNWGGNTISPGPTDTARVTVLPEFTLAAVRYNEYKIKAVKMSYYPLLQINTNADSGMYYVEYGSTCDPLPGTVTTDNELKYLLDYKVYPANRPIHKYIRVSKYMKKRDREWRLTTENFYDVGSLFRVSTTGYGALSTMAKMHVTWYVMFKGQVAA